MQWPKAIDVYAARLANEFLNNKFLICMPLYHSTAAEQQKVVKAKGGRLHSVLCFNGNAAARFLHIYNLSRAVTAAVSGVAEVSTIDFGGLTGADLEGTHFSFYSAAGLTQVSFVVDGVPVDEIAGAVAVIPVELEAADDAEDIAAAVDAVLDVYDTSLFTTSVSTDTVTITQATTGARQNISAGDSGAAVATTTPGVDAVPSPLLSLVAILPVAAGATVVHSFSSGERLGLDLSEGIVLANSTAAQTYTAGSADSWFTAIFE